MPKLVTNNRANNLSSFENPYWLGKLRKEGITEELLEHYIKCRYKKEKETTRQYSQFRQYAGQTMMLLCIKYKICTKAGFVYAVIHPLFTNAVKLGETQDCEDRLLQYQTGCPNRSYQRVWQSFVLDRKVTETLLFKELDALRLQGEWFSMQTEDTLRIKQELNALVKN